METKSVPGTHDALWWNGSLTLPFVASLTPTISIAIGLLMLSVCWLWRAYQQVRPSVGTKELLTFKSLRASSLPHPVKSEILRMVDEDGASSWPPASDHENWPFVLRPYKDIYLETAPMLPTASISLDEDVDQNRRLRYRQHMQRLLLEHIDLQETVRLLDQVESGCWDAMTKEAYNGFYSCIASLRHAYR